MEPHKVCRRRPHCQYQTMMEPAKVGAASILLLALIALVLANPNETIDDAQARGDTYLDAYADSHGEPAVAPESLYSSPGRYGPPKQLYGPPQNHYGPPHQVYGPPQSVYGPPTGPAGHYGPPSGPGGYPPPHHHHHHHGEPHDFHPIPFSAPDILPLPILTILKIVLKVVIFKLIVKFIAIICLLLFIPKFEIHKMKGSGGGGSSNDDDDEERGWYGGKDDLFKNELAYRVNSAIDAMTGRYEQQCSSSEDWACRLQSAAQEVDKKMTFARLLNYYIPVKGSNSSAVNKNQTSTNERRR